VSAFLFTLITGGLTAALVFAVGLLLVGAPAWGLAHRLGLRRAWHAALLGAVLTGAAMALIGMLGLAREGAWSFFAARGLRPSTAIGAVVGVVVARTAYGPGRIPR